MKKFFLKKIVPILLTICIVFSMTFVVSAALPGAILYALVKVAEGIALGIIAGYTAEVATEATLALGGVYEELIELQQNDFEFIGAFWPDNSCSDCSLQHVEIYTALDTGVEVSDETAAYLQYVYDFLIYASVLWSIARVLFIYNL